MKMTAEQEQLAAELFKSDDKPLPAKGEGKTRLTVRFDSTQPGVIYYGPHEKPKRKVRIPGAVVLSFKVDTSAKTPTGGRYTRQSLLVRTRDGRKWTGTVKSGTDVIVLRLLSGKQKSG